MTRMVQFDGVYQSHIDPEDHVPGWTTVLGHRCRVVGHRDGYVEDDFVHCLVTRQLIVEMPEALYEWYQAECSRLLQEAVEREHCYYMEDTTDDDPQP